MREENLNSWISKFSGDTKRRLDGLLREDDLQRSSGVIIFPNKTDILRSLELVGRDDVKCAILGQDPYHEAGQAMGLAFSVPNGIKIPPSLRNIFKEYHNDLGYDIPKSGNLTKWAEQGVLLLNTVLTVEEGKANSHKDMGWQTVTSEILKIVLERDKPVVFLLWGKQAIETAESVEKYDLTRCAIWLRSTHPSPLSATRWSDGWKLRPFIGSKPFSRANDWLKTFNQEEIDWKLE